MPPVNWMLSPGTPVVSAEATDGLGGLSGIRELLVSSGSHGSGVLCNEEVRGGGLRQLLGTGALLRRLASPFPWPRSSVRLLVLWARIRVGRR